MSDGLGRREEAHGLSDNRRCEMTPDRAMAAVDAWSLEAGVGDAARLTLAILAVIGVRVAADDAPESVRVSLERVPPTHVALTLAWRAPHRGRRRLDAELVDYLDLVTEAWRLETGEGAGVVALVCTVCDVRADGPHHTPERGPAR